MNQIKVSVIIPIYNTEEYLAKCLESVLKQSLKEIEIICINDCSKDESEKIINRYKEQDERIIYKINEKNMGLSYSRNIGIQCAKGEYIFFWIPMIILKKIHYMNCIIIQKKWRWIYCILDIMIFKLMVCV